MYVPKQKKKGSRKIISESEIKETRYTLEEVDYMFAGFNLVNEEFRVILARTISKLPKEIVEWATEKLLFISSTDDCWAFSLLKEEWRHKEGIIFLCECLKNDSEERQTFRIAHEIAHQKLKHKSPIFNRLTEEEVWKQEKEATKLAEKWLQT